MNKSVLLNSIKIFVPVLIFVASVVYIITTLKNDSEKELTLNTEEAGIQLKVEAINEVLTYVIGDVKILSSINAFRELWEDPTREDTKQYIATVFENVSNERKIYDQIRLIGADGMELVRVDSDNSGNNAAVSKILQNKKDRPYFSNTIALNNGEIFVSPFDLNVEKDTVEVPFKPVLRIATPVFDKHNEKKGILILNYKGKRLLERTATAEHNPTGSQFMLLNSDSYWLKADKPAFEWGFMFSNKQNVNFRNAFTDEWKIINAENEGQFENNKGLFTFKTIYPLENNDPSTIKTLYTADRELKFPNSIQNYYWKAVSFVPHSVLHQSSDSRIRLAIIVFIVLAIFCGLWSYAFALSVHKRALAEKEIRMNEIKLRELNATKDRFFSIIAHDLRSPFNTMMVISDVLREDLENNTADNINEYTELLTQSIKNTYRLLTQLLDWANLQLNETKFTPEEIDAHECISENLQLAKPTAQNKNITINNTIPKNTKITADSNMFCTISRNLISNAIKFTPDGGTVELTVRKEKHEHIFSVTDTGVGIDKDSLEKLFKIEESFSTIGTSNEEGTGLGLILCKELVEKHSGRIWVESEPGKGTTFYFSIPG